ncbi:YraN family protein [Novosphingobium sp.]|uniref:YraN family protein n=1 Tax=Novosphingobium sp. TaxID=1874826 RepID=UPI003D12CCC5
MSRRKSRAERDGQRAERTAAWYLRAKGWRILQRQVRVGQGRGVGEVDIIARRGRVLAFIEVKWRREAKALDQAIDERRLRRAARVAQALAPQLARPTDDVRIDVILLAPWHWPRHITHVWQP